MTLGNINTMKKSRGFTIVELLIVIVIIAILAAITIVAYNGIQDRANNTTAKETANQVRTKVEAYNSVKGEYPAVIDDLDNIKESKLDAGVKDKISATRSKEKPVSFAPCPAGTTTPKTGAVITYWQVGNTQEQYNLGTGC